MSPVALRRGLFSRCIKRWLFRRSWGRSSNEYRSERESAGASRTKICQSDGCVYWLGFKTVTRRLSLLMCCSSTILMTLSVERSSGSKSTLNEFAFFVRTTVSSLFGAGPSLERRFHWELWGVYGVRKSAAFRMWRFRSDALRLRRSAHGRAGCYGRVGKKARPASVWEYLSGAAVLNLVTSVDPRWITTAN